MKDKAINSMHYVQHLLEWLHVHSQDKPNKEIISIEFDDQDKKDLVCLLKEASKNGQELVSIKGTNFGSIFKGLKLNEYETAALKNNSEIHAMTSDLFPKTQAGFIAKNGLLANSEITKWKNLSTLAKAENLAKELLQVVFKLKPANGNVFKDLVKEVFRIYRFSEVPEPICGVVDKILASLPEEEFRAKIEPVLIDLHDSQNYKYKMILKMLPNSFEKLVNIRKAEYGAGLKAHAEFSTSLIMLLIFGIRLDSDKARFEAQMQKHLNDRQLVWAKSLIQKIDQENTSPDNVETANLLDILNNMIDDRHRETAILLSDFMEVTGLSRRELNKLESDKIVRIDQKNGMDFVLLDRLFWSEQEFFEATKHICNYKAYKLAEVWRENWGQNFALFNTIFNLRLKSHGEDVPRANLLSMVFEVVEDRLMRLTEVQYDDKESEQVKKDIPYIKEFLKDLKFDYLILKVTEFLQEASDLLRKSKNDEFMRHNFHLNNAILSWHKKDYPVVIENMRSAISHKDIFDIGKYELLLKLPQEYTKQVLELFQKRLKIERKEIANLFGENKVDAIVYMTGLDFFKIMILEKELDVPIDKDASFHIQVALKKAAEERRADREVIYKRASNILGKYINFYFASKGVSDQSIKELFEPWQKVLSAIPQLKQEFMYDVKFATKKSDAEIQVMLKPVVGNVKGKNKR